MTTVYVINKEGEPLDPTTRCGHVRILLKEKRARVVSVKPFTIQLLYETKGDTKVMCGATDPGRTNIGNAVITEEGDCL